MISNDINQKTYELNFNIDEVAIYVFATGQDVPGTFYPDAGNGKGLVGFWLLENADMDDLLDKYRRGLMSVEPRRFSRLLGELHRRAARIELAGRNAGEMKK